LTQPFGKQRLPFKIIKGVFMMHVADQVTDILKCRLGLRRA